MTRVSIISVALIVAYAVSFLVSAGLTGRLDVALINAGLEVAYKFSIPILMASFAGEWRRFLMFFGSLSVLLSIVRGYRASFVDFRSGGVDFFVNGDPTIMYFVFEISTIAAICGLLFLVGEKYGKR